MPPQGKSTGYALEDASLLARVMAAKLDNSLSGIFLAHQTVRRGPVNKAYDEAAFG